MKIAREIRSALASENFFSTLLNEKSLFLNKLKKEKKINIDIIKNIFLDKKQIYLYLDIANKIAKENFIDSYYFLSAIFQINNKISNTLISCGINEELLYRIKKETEYIDKKLFGYDYLTNFGRDLTNLASENKLSPIIGREEELSNIIRILNKKIKNNAVLIGDAGVGKTAIIEKLAQKIINGDVPDILKDKIIFELDIALLVSGSTFRGQFEERVENIIDILKKNNGKIILFIDEIHKIVGSGKGEGNLDTASIFKPILARDEIKIIGATTPEEYMKTIEKDKALDRRFIKVRIEEPNKEETKKILFGIKESYEKYFNLEIEETAIEAAINLSNRYLSNKKFPDKAVDLLDEACSLFKLEYIYDHLSEYEKIKDALKENTALMENFSKFLYKWEQRKNYSKKYIETKNKISKLEEEQEKCIKIKDIEKYKNITFEIDELKRELERIKLECPNVSVSEFEIGVILNKWTGIPVNKLVEEDKDKLLNLKDKLKERIINQEEAVENITNAIIRNRSLIRDPKRPIGVFLFIGPTGVGKTELAKQLSYHLFNSEKNLIRIDMSEYKEGHNLSRLIGAPPGYVGYDEGGQLTEAIKNKPYSVILFDEIEKAHDNIFDAFLQIFDDGRLTDGQGKTIDFRNTLILMTSNIGTKKINGEITPLIKEEILNEIKKRFKLEFINRIDEIIFFNPLTKIDISKIIDIYIKELNERLQDKGIIVKLTNRMKNKIINEAYNIEYGARNIKRYIEKHIETELAYKLLKNNISGEIIFDDKETHLDKEPVKTSYDTDEIPDDEFFKLYPVFTLYEEDKKNNKKIKKEEEEKEEEID